MERYLITQSLLSAWNYAFSCHESYFDEAYEDFLCALNRKPHETNQHMQNGIEFETEVYKQANGEIRSPHPKWENGIKAVSEIITGASVQVKVSREITVGNYPLLVYGILDALKAGTIYDVKFCNKSFHSAELAGKYLDSPQHPAYLFMVPEAFDFTYLVSDGIDLYTETYSQKSSPSFEDILKNFLFYLKKADLINIYKEKWKAL